MAQKNGQGLFQQNALERLRSPDQLDKLFAPTTTVAWVALVTILLLVLSALVWSIFGVMAVKVTGAGIMIDSGGVVNVSHSAGGRLRDVKVKAGERVRQGQVIATVEQPTIQAQLARMNRELNMAQSRIDMSNMVASINELQAKLEQESQVVSPVDGVISDQIVSGPGEFITAGEPLFSVRMDEQQRDELLVLLYVPALEGKKIQPGMVVQVAPGSVDSSEYGTLIGQVHSVSSYPVMADSITGWTGNKDLSAWIVKQSGGSVMEVKVDLIKDSSTPTGYLWSSVNGAPEKITPGTVFTGSVVVKRQAPITKAFLKLNQWLRSD